jgi:hypothetical protein
MLSLTGCTKKECLKSHKENKHSPVYCQAIPIGKTFSMICYPARDYEEEVCDEYKEIK